MLLNSFEFILVFLPLSLAVYYCLGVIGRRAQISAICGFSIIFYYIWSGYTTIWLLISVIVNFVFSVAIQRYAKSDRIAKIVVTSSIAFNILYLAYFKYASFIASQFFGLNSTAYNHVLPLGISFFSFTQTMYLIDLYRRQSRQEDLLTYGGFVVFYPHLPSGPLYHYSEIMPQLKRKSERSVFEACLSC